MSYHTELTARRAGPYGWNSHDELLKDFFLRGEKHCFHVMSGHPPCSTTHSASRVCSSPRLFSEYRTLVLSAESLRLQVGDRAVTTGGPLPFSLAGNPIQSGLHRHTEEFWHGIRGGAPGKRGHRADGRSRGKKAGPVALRRGGRESRHLSRGRGTPGQETSSPDSMVPPYAAGARTLRPGTADNGVRRFLGYFWSAAN